MEIYLQFERVILDLDGQPPVAGSLLEQAALATLEHCQADQKVELSLVLTGDEQIQELNQQYLGIDAPTDVISFPADEMDPETEAPYLGDVVLSFSRAQVQAESAGHPVQAELQLLVVHGVLHLLGYDHSDAQEKALMWQIQDQVLTTLGCPARPTDT
jgi:probable rRNA maturation factor